MGDPASLVSQTDDLTTDGDPLGAGVASNESQQMFHHIRRESDVEELMHHNLMWVPARVH